MERGVWMEANDFSIVVNAKAERGNVATCNTEAKKMNNASE